MARDLHTATLLDNGKVLVAGARLTAPLVYGTESVEVYDPATDGWSSAGSMAAARFNHTATLLDNGKVLVVGGIDNNGMALASAEIYDPATDEWSSAGSMAAARADHTATLLPNGKVLVAGGADGDRAEVYDPATNGWSTAGSMAAARFNHTATLLDNGKVLVVGGAVSAGPLASAEIYDPAGDRWSSAGSMATARYAHTAALLDDGKVLVAGGIDNNGMALASAEIYDPATDGWTGAGSMATARFSHTATLLPSGKVLVAGGVDPSCRCVTNVVASAEQYTPPTALVASDVDFGDQPIASPSAVRDVVVTNTGDSNLFVTGAVLAGANGGSDFTVTDDGCTNKTVAPNGVCKLGVRFTPSGDGPRTATLTLADNNATDGTDDVALTGTGMPTSSSGSGGGGTSPSGATAGGGGTTPATGTGMPTSSGTGGEGTSPSGGSGGTAGGGATTPATLPVVGPVDTTPPVAVVSLKAARKLGTVLKNGLVVTLGANEPATFKIELLLDRKLAKKFKLKPRVARATVTLAAAGTHKVNVKLSASARRQLAQQRRVKLTVSVRATDTAGNRRARTIAVHLNN